jgi:glycosyltransferase involved in cell wall biosynthesis
MRVVLLSHEYPPFIFGGVGTFVCDLAHGLARLGAEVTVVTGFPVPHKQERRFDDGQGKDGRIDVVRLPYPNVPPRHSLFQIYNMKQLQKIVTSVSADVVHGQCGSAFPAILGMRGSAPVIVTFHGSLKTQRTLSLLSITRGGSVRDLFTYAIGYPFWAYTLKNEFEDAQATVAVSETVMKELMSEVGGECREKWRFIYNGVDLENLDKISAYDRTQEETGTVLFGGRLFWSKGVLNLITLAYLLQKRHHLDLKIVIYGSGPLYRKIRQKARAQGLTNIVLKEFTSRDKFLKAMTAASFVVIPSFYEASPMLLLESMCLGRIPVTFNLPYANEFTQNGNYGILANDIEEMAARIHSMYSQGTSDNLRSRIREFARKNYDINESAAKYYRLYREISETFKASHA